MPPEAPSENRSRTQLLDDFPRAALQQHVSRTRQRSRSPPKRGEQNVPAPEVLPQATPRRARETDTEVSEAPAKRRAMSVPAPAVTPSKDEDDISDEDFSQIAEAFFQTPDHAYALNAVEILMLTTLNSQTMTLPLDFWYKRQWPSHKPSDER